MAKLNGAILSGQYESTEVFNWNDEKTGKVTPLRSFQVLVENGDGTRTRHKISLPDGYSAPNLKENEFYAFPVVAGLNKKRMEVRWTARTDLMPFPAPDMQ